MPFFQLHTRKDITLFFIYLHPFHEYFPNIAVSLASLTYRTSPSAVVLSKWCSFSQPRVNKKDLTSMELNKTVTSGSRFHRLHSKERNFHYMLNNRVKVENLRIYTPIQRISSRRLRSFKGTFARLKSLSSIVRKRNNEVLQRRTFRAWVKRSY